MAPAQGPASDPVHAGISRIEGYLLWQAELAQARADAEAAARSLEWLTSGQREEVVRCLAGRQIELSRLYLDRTAQRAHSLRAEYERRYAVLRTRLAASVLGICSAAVLGLCLAYALRAGR